MRTIAAVIAAVALCLPLSAQAAVECIPEQCAAQGGTCFNNFCWVKLPSDENCIELMEADEVPIRHVNFIDCPNSVSNGGGVSIEVIPSYEFGWFLGTVNELTPTPPVNGSFLRFKSFGTTTGTMVVPISVGTVTTTSLGKELTCDFTPLGSATHRVELYNGETLVLSANGRSGVAARCGQWPSHVDFGQRSSRPTETWSYAAPTTIQVPGVGSGTGDRVVLIAEGTAAVQSYVRSETPSQGIHDYRILPDIATDVPGASPTMLYLVSMGMMGMGAIAMLRSRRRATRS